MRPLRNAPRRGRRGKILVMSALMLPATLGMVALAVDSGVLGVSRAQLQTAADSAALAGVVGLKTTSRLQGGAATSSDLNTAQSRAMNFAASNSVLGQAASLTANPSNSNTGSESLVVGYSPRPFDSSQPLLTGSAWLPYYNTVLIRASRTSASGGQIPVGFGAIFGTSGADLRVTASASIVGVAGFSANGSYSAVCLPIVLDKSTYGSMIQGQTTDQFAYNASNGTVTTGADGVTESKLYPVTSGYPGNWGTINIGVTNNSTSIISAQIRYGITPQQLATYPNSMIQPDPSTGVITFSGNPGISAAIKDDLTSIIGKAVWLPIYDPALSGGTGNNAYFGVTAFAPVRVMAVTFRGMNKYVIVQPAPPPSDPTVVWGGLRDGLSSGQYRLVLTR